MAKTKSDLATIAAVAQLLAVVLIVAALFFARDVFIPLSLGLLLSFLLSPFVNRLHWWGVPNVLAVVTTALLAFLLLGSIFTLLARELNSLVTELPQYKTELITKARNFAGLTGGMGGPLDELAEEVTEAIEEGEKPLGTKAAEPTSVLQVWTDKLLPATGKSKKPVGDGKTAKTPIYVRQVEESLPLATWATTAGTVLGPLATAGLASVFALFLLIYREDMRDRIIAIISHGDYVTTTEALNEAAQRISRYLIAQTMINTGYGIFLAVGLSTIGATMTDDGFPNAILWGVLATCLRFIPYVGPTAAAVFPSVIALIVFPGYSVFLAVVALITTMELICNNIIEPWLYGTSTGISAVAVILAAVFWGWLWGPVGLLLSTPLTVCLVVLGRYVPRFKILSTLLSEDVEIKPSMRFYQRLLADDLHRAEEILQTHLTQNNLEQTADRTIVPALKRVRTDHDNGHLTDADANRLFAMASGLIEKLTPDETIDQSGGVPPTIVGCTAHHLSESLLLNLLRVRCAEHDRLRAIDEDTMPVDVARQVVQINAPVVVIAIVPPGGFVQARYLCKAIRREGYAGVIIVACFGRFKNFDRLFVKFRKAGATNMTTTFTQTSNKIDSVLRRRESSAANKNTPPKKETLSPTVP